MERGRIVGRFCVERFLGKGSMSQVWAALDGARMVALKIVEEEGEPRLISEAGVLGLLDHPNVPYLVAVDLAHEPPYLAMEFVDGVSLDHEIERRSRTQNHFELDKLARLTEEIASTLHYAHSMSVVHRDLKPANVMLLNRAGRIYVKLLDFGVAVIRLTYATSRSPQILHDLSHPSSLLLRTSTS